MPSGFDPSGDLAQVADGLEAVVVTRPRGSLSCSVTKALRTRVTTQQPAPSAGRSTAADITWNLPLDELTFALRPGDVIVDASAQRWTVLELRESTLRGQIRCACRNLALANGLDAHVDIEQADYSKSDAGAEVAVWTPFRTGVKARIQPARGQVNDLHQRPAVHAEFTIFLDEDIALNARHRIKGPDATRYRVIAWSKADRIDALMEIRAARLD